MVTVAAQSGSWRHWPFRLPRKYSFGLGVYVLMPLLANVLGYFPSSVVGLGEDLPKGVALEWAKWCRSRHYLFSYAHELDLSRYAALRLPILAYSFADDDFAPRPAVDALFAHYPNARVTRKHVRPVDLDVKAIGHFGFFRREFRDSLWSEVSGWLKQH
jgi:predicted alpha/beta hydrolase